MKILPAGRDDLLEFVRVHLPAWQADPAAVGLAPAQLAALAAQLAEADAAFTHAKGLRQEAQAATIDSNAKLSALRASTGTALAVIKAFARASAEGGSVTAPNEVYARAQIDMPLKPGTLPAPGRVDSVAITVDTQGRPTLTWTAPAPRDARERAAGRAGVWYQVCRKDPGAAAFLDIGGSGTTSFTDTPLRPGNSTYTLRALRGDRAGPWSQAMSVQVGVGVGVGAGVGVGLTGMRRATRAAAA